MGKEGREEVKKISRSGRLLIRPKKVRTTSSDEGPPRKKRSKGQITVQKEFEKLRHAGKDMTDADKPKQSHAFSEQQNTPNKCDDMTAKGSMKKK